MIFSGTTVNSKNATLYSQNLPFASTFTSDSIASYSQTPTTCGNGSAATFTLQLTNSNWTPSGNGISKVVIQAPTFNPPLIQTTPPTGWTYSVSSGTITWTALSSAYYINPGQTLPFSWSGTAPVVNTGTQAIFLSTATWTGSDTILSQPIVTGCYIG